MVTILIDRSFEVVLDMKKNKRCQDLLCNVVQCFTKGTRLRICGFGALSLGIQFSNHIRPFQYTMSLAYETEHIEVDDTSKELILDACRSNPFTILGACDYEKALSVVSNGRNRAHYVILITSLVGKEDVPELLEKLHAKAHMTVFDIGGDCISTSVPRDIIDKACISF